MASITPSYARKQLTGASPDLQENSLLVYCDKKSARFEYICDFIFNDVLGVKYNICYDSKIFESSPLPKINYSQQHLTDEPFIKATSFLFETAVKPRSKPNIFFYEEQPAFFATKHHLLLPFDIFAASFYLLSRYEEYQPFEADEHNRFKAAESFAFQNNFLQKPIINIWCSFLKKEISKQFGNLSFSQKKYTFQPTIDIDSVFAYRNKGFLRTVGASLRDIRNLAFSRLRKRWSVVLHLKKDPFEVFDEISKIHELYRLKPIIFFQVGDYGQFDKNISHKKKAFRKIIKQTAEKFTVGIHPSYNASEYKNPKHRDLLKNEIERLGEITGKPVKCSRQHFLRISFPETYRLLTAHGIEQDYSMGYASQNGFRAGTCTPFRFFDVIKNRTSTLRVYPFQLMDATFKHYLHSSPEEAKQIIKDLVESVKETGGTFCSLWHNETLANDADNNDWYEAYRFLLQKASKR